MKEKIFVPKGTANVVERAMRWKEGDDPYWRLTEDECISVTANFGNGFLVDVKCCGTQYDADSPGNNCAWAEAVLFKDGCEICCSEPSDDFFGQWVLEYEDIKFIVEVVK